MAAARAQTSVRNGESGCLRFPSQRSLEEDTKAFLA